MAQHNPFPDLHVQVRESAVVAEAAAGADHAHDVLVRHEGVEEVPHVRHLGALHQQRVNHTWLPLAKRRWTIESTEILIINRPSKLYLG